MPPSGIFSLRQKKGMGKSVNEKQHGSPFEGKGYSERIERKTGDPPINRGERRMIKLRPARDQRSARIASRPIFTAVKIVSSSLEDRRIDGRRFKEEFGEREREGKERKSRTYDRTDWFRAEKNYGENTKKKKRREEKRNTTHLDHHRSSTCTRYSPWMAA